MESSYVGAFESSDRFEGKGGSAWVALSSLALGPAADAPKLAGGPTLSASQIARSPRGIECRACDSQPRSGAPDRCEIAGPFQGCNVRYPRVVVAESAGESPERAVPASRGYAVICARVHEVMCQMMRAQAPLPSVARLPEVDPPVDELVVREAQQKPNHEGTAEKAANEHHCDGVREQRHGHPRER